MNDHIWDIISNQEAISVNQAYAGDSGGVYETSTSTVVLDKVEKYSLFPDVSIMSRNLDESTLDDAVPSYQYLSKPLGQGKVAVLLMNSDTDAAELTAKFSDIPELSCDNNNHSVRDIWDHMNRGSFEDTWSTLVDGHDSAFIVVECA